MDDAGFIIGSYVLTFVSIGLFAWVTVRRGRRLAEHVPPEEQYWT
ncbi:hypothetical protein BH23ACT3_BH23ACT3_14650 [soil metagenome]